jgi:hypothetical protein
MLKGHEYLHIHKKGKNKNHMDQCAVHAAPDVIPVF